VVGARIRRAREGTARTSLLPINGLAGLETAGFDIVGEVLGAAVMQATWANYHGCGWVPGVGGGWTPGLTTIDRWVTYQPYRQAIRSGWDNALGRMLREAAGIGADGVVAVRLEQRPLEREKREFTALGTAVRSRGSARPEKPFATGLAGPDVAKLLAAGWVPAGILCGWCVAVTHDDWRVKVQTRRLAGNTEVTGYTELVEHVRDGARRDLADRAARLGADGVLMSGIRLDVRRLETDRGRHLDHAAECLITGTAIARFRSGSGPASSSLTVLPLRDPGRPGPKKR
jgi:uncharacterized protein YbjQ (UPF0145 family)